MEPKYGEPWVADGDVWDSAVWIRVLHGQKHYNLFNYKSNAIEAGYLRRVALEHNACSGLSDSEVAEMRRLYDERRKS